MFFGVVDGVEDFSHVSEMHWMRMGGDVGLWGGVGQTSFVDDVMGPSTTEWDVWRQTTMLDNVMVPLHWHGTSWGGLLVDGLTAANAAASSEVVGNVVEAAMPTAFVVDVTHPKNGKQSENADDNDRRIVRCVKRCLLEQMTTLIQQRPSSTTVQATLKRSFSFSLPAT